MPVPTRCPAFFFGWEKRIGNPLLGRVVDSRSRIGHFHPGVGTGSKVVPYTKLRIHVDGRGFDKDITAVGHRLPGIHQ